jgi:hypothetical protein
VASTGVYPLNLRTENLSGDITIKAGHQVGVEAMADRVFAKEFTAQ